NDGSRNRRPTDGDRLMRNQATIAIWPPLLLAGNVLLKSFVAIGFPSILNDSFVPAKSRAYRHTASLALIRPVAFDLVLHNTPFYGSCPACAISSGVGS